MPYSTSITPFYHLWADYEIIFYQKFGTIINIHYELEQVFSVADEHQQDDAKEQQKNVEQNSTEVVNVPVPDEK